MSSRELRRALESLLAASPDEWPDILSRNPELLTPAVDEPLAYLIDAARRDGDGIRVLQAQNVAEFLRQGRAMGPRGVLAALGGGDADAPTDAAHDFWDLYRSTGDPNMLEAAIERWEVTFAETPRESPDYVVAANNLATGLAARHDRTHAPDDLRRALEASEQALRGTSPTAPERATRLSNWATLLLQRFDASGDAADLDAAIGALQEAVGVAVATSSARALCLTNYAAALYTRYKQSRDDADLDALIDAAQEAVRLTPPGSRDYAERQSSLAAGLERRYLDRGDVEALDRALAAWDEALNNGAPGAPVPLELMFAAGRGLWRRHRLTADPHDRVAAAELLGSAYIWGRDDARPLLDQLLAFTAEEGRADAPPELMTLVDRVGFELASYRETGRVASLDAAIRGWPLVLAQPALGAEHPASRATALHDAGQALWSRFEVRGSDNDMNAAIESFEEAVSLTAPDSPNLAPRRANLGFALSVRAERSADARDLDRAQELLEAALAAELPRDVRASITRNLATVLTQAAVRGPAERAVGILTHEIELLDDALDILDEESPEWTPTIFARAAARLELYDRTDERETLEQAIVDLDGLQPEPSSGEELQRLISLARALVDRHTRLGRREDLDRGITTLERAVDAAAGSRLEAVMLEELGLARLRRGVNLNRLSDLERAIDALTAALDDAPPGSLEYYERLGCLGVAELEHAADRRDHAEFGRARNRLREAVEHLPSTSQRRPLVLHALADTLKGGKTEDKEEAARLREEAERLEPVDRGRAMSSGNVLLDRYESTGTRSDLDEAVAAFEAAAALELGPQFRALNLSALGRALVTRHRGDGEAADRDRAVECFRTACALAAELDPMIVFRAAQSWAALEATDVNWTAAAEPYRHGLQALARLLTARALRSEKEVWLRDARGFAADAALAFAFARDSRAAVVALEQNRALLLTDVLQREQFDLEQLRSAGHTELAQRYEWAAERVGALETAEVAGDGLEAPRPARSSLADEVEDARAALDAAVADIRSVQGYENMFAAPSFDEIVRLAGDVPVLYLCPGPTWGAAFVVTKDAQPPILLTSLLTDRVAVGADYYLTAYAGRVEDPERWRGQLDLTLKWLWDVALGPLLDIGDFTDVLRGVTAERLLAARNGEGARPVVVVPVGLLALLPLHAAWTPDGSAPGGRRYALDELCITYAPNVRVFAEARRRARRGDASRLLAVEEPLPVTAGPLPAVAAEVAAAVRAASTATVLRHENAAVEKVLVQLRDHTVAHFACHGQADPDDPLASFLLLAGDERLTLRTIMEQRLADLGLVVLSACETAVVGRELPDEVVGLPAGLLRAGAGGVIASSWSVPDVSTAILLTRFYELWQEQNRSDPAEALRRAQQWVRDSSNGEKLEHMPELMDAADRVPASARRLWEKGHGHRHPYFWAGFAYVGG